MNVLVPIEPTEEMVAAMLQEFYRDKKTFDPVACYQAMLEVCPADSDALTLLRAVQIAIESGRDFHGLPLVQLREYLLRSKRSPDGDV